MRISAYYALLLVYGVISLLMFNEHIQGDVPPIRIYRNKAVLDCDIDFDDNSKTCLSTLSVIYMFDIYPFMYLGLIYCFNTCIQALSIYMYYPGHINFVRYIENAAFASASVFVITLAGVQNLYTLLWVFVIILATDLLNFVIDITILFSDRTDERIHMDVLLITSRIVFVSIWLHSLLVLYEYAKNETMPWHLLVIPIVYFILQVMIKYKEYTIQNMFRSKRDNAYFSTKDRTFGSDIHSSLNVLLRITLPLLYYAGTRKFTVKFI